jgi:beta-N-acetylglucosaminidase
MSPLKILLAAVLFGGILAGQAGGAGPAPANTHGFSVRLVRLSGDPARSETKTHVKFCRELGFNGLWVEGAEAGVWTKQAAPSGPVLGPSFLKLVRWCRRHDMDVWVSIDPVAETPGNFTFSDAENVQRVSAFAKLLRDQAEIRHVVVSFDSSSDTLHELSDVFAYGAAAAPAQISLTKRVVEALPADVEVWLRASAHCDAHLGDGTSPFAKAFLSGLEDLPPAVGIVWSGPKPVSPTITGAQLAAARARMGNRKLLLYDYYPANGNDEDDAMALIIGALRGRAPDVHDAADAYLACPETPLAGSRLSLLTIAEFLRDPASYDSEAATKRAVARLAGGNRDAETALTTQQLEWGGFPEGRNYWPRDDMNPIAAGRRLLDPAFVDSFTWTAARYPSRMAALTHLTDHAFRDDLLRMMRRRLAVARAMPLVVDYYDRLRHNLPGTDEVLAAIEVERRSWDHDDDARRALESFLASARIPLATGTP